MTPRRFRPRRLSDRANTWLEALADDLVTGECTLAEAPPGARALVVVGYDFGRASLAPSLAQAQADAAMFYDLWANPDARQRHAAALDRIDDALDAHPPASDAALVALACHAAQPPAPPRGGRT